MLRVAHRGPAGLTIFAPGSGACLVVSTATQLQAFDAESSGLQATSAVVGGFLVKIWQRTGLALRNGLGAGIAIGEVEVLQVLGLSVTWQDGSLAVGAI